jgi:hypothetical protein
VSAYADFAKKGTLFSNFFALTHPSQPNYIGLIAGDTFENELDYGNSVVDFPNANAPNANSTIIDLIEAKGLSWKVYLENYPEGGTTDEFWLYTYPFETIGTVEVTNGPARGKYSAKLSIFGPQTGLPAKQMIVAQSSGIPLPGQDFTNKLVIIPRGGSTFTSKVMNAQIGGAAGVIIYNSETGSGTFTPGGLFTPGGVDPNITIPSVGISRADGLFIVQGITTDPNTIGILNMDFPNTSALGQYARKHNPFVSFLNISTNPERMSHLVNAKQFAKDVACDRVPDFAFYIPNQNNAAHDLYTSQVNKTAPIEYFVPYYGGEAFETTFGLALRDRSFIKNRTVVLTFDEDDSSEGNNNKIYCAFYGSNVKRGEVVDIKYNLYNLLRTIEDSLKIGTLGRNDSKSSSMIGWKKHSKSCHDSSNYSCIEQSVNENSVNLEMRHEDS